RLQPQRRGDDRAAHRRQRPPQAVTVGGHAAPGFELEFERRLANQRRHAGREQPQPQRQREREQRPAHAAAREQAVQERRRRQRQHRQRRQDVHVALARAQAEEQHHQRERRQRQPHPRVARAPSLPPGLEQPRQQQRER